MHHSVDVQQSKTQLRLIQLAGILPVGIGLAAYLMSPAFQSALNEGVRLLVQGNPSALREWAASFGIWAPLATSLLMVVQALAAPIPAVLITATNSLLFGPFIGGLLSIFSASVAAFICFGIARTCGEPLVCRLLPDSVLKKTDTFVASHGVTAILVARLLPFVPFDPISYVAGLSRMNAWHFFLATLIGQIPAGMTYSYLAQEIDRPVRMAVMIIGALVGLMLFGLMMRKVLLSDDPKTE